MKRLHAGQIGTCTLHREARAELSSNDRFLPSTELALPKRDPATAIAWARCLLLGRLHGRSRHSGLGWWRHRCMSHLPEAQTRPSSDGRVGQKSFGVVRPERHRIRDEGLVDICHWALDFAENPDSEATAGIEPAMKVLQTSGLEAGPSRWTFAGRQKSRWTEVQEKRRRRLTQGSSQPTPNYDLGLRRRANWGSREPVPNARPSGRPGLSALRPRSLPRGR
jgi:hypothetical protein